MNSEFNRIKLEHSHAFIADTLKRTKVEEDDIVIKTEAHGEDDANKVDEYFDLDVSSVAQKFKSYSRSTYTTLLSEESVEERKFNNQMNHLELEDNWNIINKIHLSVPANDDSVDTDAKEILVCYQNHKKMKTEERICRFCFKMCCNFKTIDGDIKDVSDVLLPDIDLAAIQEPVMCTHCEKVLFMSFDFKKRCFYTHDYLVPFANKKEDSAKLNLKEIYMTRNKNNTTVLEGQDICGFCMCPVKNCSAVFLDVGERYVMLRKTLEQCLPELDLSIIKEPVICAPCQASLENHSRFVRNVLVVEERIKKYKESLGINSKSKMDLSSLAQFVLSEVDGSGGETEKMFCDHNESVDKAAEQKSNAMGIDDLKFNNEPKFTPTNMLDYEIESNEIGAVKIEETFCPEDRAELKKEHIVELEDQKIFDEQVDIKPEEHNFSSFEDGIVMTQLNPRLNDKQKCTVSSNFEDNLLQLHNDQTCLNKNVTKITPYLYDCGPFKAENKHHLESHLLKHEDRSKITIYKCVSCSFQTNDKDSLEINSLSHKDLFEVIMYKCHSCTYQTKYKSVLESHLVEHKNPEVTILKCDSCAYRTIRKRNLTAHLLGHKDISEVTVHKCDSCTYQTKYKSHLKRHLLKHKDISEVTMYKCDSCVYESKYKSELKIHLLKHRNPSEVPMHKCDSCAYQTIRKRALRNHLLNHKDISEITMFKCDSCAYQAVRKRSLQVHLLMHKNISEVAMHKCDSCAYQTVRLTSLKSHLLKHKNPSEVAMHKCDACPYQALRKNTLKMHMLIHKDISEITMHKCDSCSYQSKYKTDLRKHMLKHKNPSDVTMYQCASCAYQTILKSTLKRHLLTHKDISKVKMYKHDSSLYQTNYKTA